ncbi:MAG TPA: hypothetical protein VFN69_04400 [Rudaea sp.]|nr:hypothetical protein [Rudaea sp.]
MIYIIALLLLAIAALEALRVRAARNHTTVLTVLHAEIADLKTDAEKFESRFDGGTIPK